MRPRLEERGYALVAAVAAIAIFALAATVIVAATRGTALTVGAEVGQARAAASADAGLALAIDHLVSRSPVDRWSIDGRARTIEFGMATLTIRIEDERSKIPINLLNEEQARRLLEAVGLKGDRLSVATDSLLDWLDDDDEPRTDGAESEYYKALHFAPRNGPLVSIGELARIRGFDAAVVERIKPYITINWGGGPFERRFARPEALNVMREATEDPVAEIESSRELAGQTTAIELTDQVELVGRPLLVVVDAAMPDGAHARRQEILEITGSALRPYVVRSYE